MVETVTKVYDEETSRNWSPDPDVNAIFLQSVHNMCMDRLKYRGHVFLNDILDELGISRTSRGQLIGWIGSDGEDFWKLEYQIEGEEAGPITITFLTQGEIYNNIEE